MQILFKVAAILTMSFVGAANAANITLYYSPTCPHCHHAREFIESRLVYEYPQISVKSVNVMDEENRDEFFKTLEKCEYKSGGVPVLVIGEKCFQGYADFMQSDIRTAIEADLPADAVAAAAENKKAMDSDADAFRAAHTDRAGTVTEQVAKKNSNVDGNFWFYGLLIVLVGSLVFVMLRGNKTKK